MKLAVLTCERCGAALPVADEPRVTCAGCGATCEVPPEYAELRRYSQVARTSRREAERRYRKLMDGAVSEKTASRFGMFGIPLLIVGIPGLLYFTQDLAGWGVRTWIAFGVFFPSLFGILTFVFLSGRASPLAYLHAVGGRIRPGIPTEAGCPTCGACGAPLVPEPDALTATCDYCLSDSWLAAVPDTHVEGTARARENLASLVLADELHSFESWALVVISILVVGPFLGCIYLAP